jgi:hypothetical protein
MNDELQRIWKEAVVTQSMYYPEMPSGKEGKHEKFQLG